MSSLADRPIIAVVGATATGKSLLADSLAARMGAEVISADSMQVYRGMDVGTAKIPESSRSVFYHGIDLVDPEFTYTAALYQRYARQAIADIELRGRQVVICGGSGLYLRAALDDFDLDQKTDEQAVAMSLSATDGGKDLSLRAKLSAQASDLGAEAFHGLLATRDASSAALIHPNNVRRVIRAFELLDQGKSYAESSSGFDHFQSIYNVRFIGLTVQRDLLYELINVRVDAMISDGLLGEVQVLLSEGMRDRQSVSQAIGYKELIPVLEGRATLREAVEAIKQATRRYAKRQQTWFMRDPRIEWIDVTDLHRQHQEGRIDRAELAFLLQSRAWRQLQSPANQ
jgi:tRNA dimethylallyltransferase